MSEALLELSGVGKDYVSGAGVVTALAEVDLRIEAGEFVAIVGTSGSGKSTLMNVLGCLDRPSAGRYRFAGLDVGQRSADARAVVRNRMIGFIFQGFNLLSRTTALENVELPLSYRGVPAKERRRRAERALAAVGLAERMDHTPNQLSGGQQQRVAIARALVTDPPLLLADEPTGNLDTRTSLEVLALLQQLNRERGITIVLVTHEADIAACASRVITFRDGRMASDERQDTPTDASAELQKLPPPAPSAQTGAQARAQRRVVPLPRSVHWVMALSSVVSLGAGALYTYGLMGKPWPWLPVPLALLGEAWLTARFAQRRLHHPLPLAHRVRLALTGSVTTAALIALPVLLWPPVWLSRAIATRGTTSATLSLVALALLGSLLLACVRIGLLTLFSRSPKHTRTR